MVESLIHPVKERVERDLPRVVGPGLGAIEFGSDFLPKAVSPDDGGGAVGLDALSGGTEEQIFFVTRLALAQVIAAGGREAIVLDDPLVYTDAVRMARILPLLAEAARSCQILLFTCHPERYRGLPAAREFDLAALRRSVSSPIA